MPPLLEAPVLTPPLCLVARSCLLFGLPRSYHRGCRERRQKDNGGQAGWMMDGWMVDDGMAYR